VKEVYKHSLLLLSSETLKGCNSKVVIRFYKEKSF